MNTTSGVRGLGVEEVVILEVRIGVATHTCGTGGRRLQANELAAAIQDEVASGENGCITPHAADPRAEHAKGLLGRLVIVAIHVGHRTIARNVRANVIDSSRQLSKTANTEPENRALVLARHRPEDKSADLTGPISLSGVWWYLLSRSLAACSIGSTTLEECANVL